MSTFSKVFEIIKKIGINWVIGTKKGQGPECFPVNSTHSARRSLDTVYNDPLPTTAAATRALRRMRGKKGGGRAGGGIGGGKGKVLYGPARFQLYEFQEPDTVAFKNEEDGPHGFTISN